MTDFKELELTLAEISTAITEAKKKCAENGYQWNQQNERLAIAQAQINAVKYKGYVRLANDQSLPQRGIGVCANCWIQSQKDMLAAGFRKVELEGEKDG